MANRQGEFIFYELMTRDPDGAGDFYQDVVGWQITDSAESGLDHRTIRAGDARVGGVLHLTDEMLDQGARPAWFGCIAVNDLDAALDGLQALGGRGLMPAADRAGVGRIAMVADPRGAAFYLMESVAEAGTSTAFAPGAFGHCVWNELATSDPDGALAFYGELFGWNSTEAMAMGEAEHYRFIDHHDVRVGGISPRLAKGASPLWIHYFRVPDIDSARDAAEAGGGRILQGPHQVPDGDHVFTAADPVGALFALAGPKIR